jgi:tRNA nucleotidyltransferase (CCA-adding enzyme)
MTSLDVVVGRALRLVVPSTSEQILARKLARFTLERTRTAARDHVEVRGVVLGGSYAKGTWLPGKADIDIFLKIARSTPQARFEKIGLGVGAKALAGYPTGKKYAQHPYTEGIVRGVKVNIVPCYAVAKGKWKSAADRSPFHVRLVRQLPQDLKDQVRLLKQFMIGVGVYGAEIETQGFSGYVAEVLILRHRTFEGVLAHFAGFKPASKERLFSLPDPVDPSRDLGVAVSAEKLGTLVLAARSFLKKPAEAYFAGAQPRVRSALGRLVVALTFDHVELSEDILWGELRRSLRHFVRHVEEKGFKIARSMAVSNNSNTSAFLFLPEVESLPSLEQRTGPGVELQEEVNRFVASNRGRARLFWVDEEGRLRLIQRRDDTSLKVLLATMAKSGSRSTGASADVARGLRRSARVLEGERLKSAKNPAWLTKGVERIVSDAIGAG